MELRSITTEADLDELVEVSKKQPVLLFKHSNACPVSSRAHSQVAKLLESANPASFVAAIVTVQTARPLSNRIEERFGIRHETPQAILLRDGSPVWNASHWDVSEAKLAVAIDRG